MKLFIAFFLIGVTVAVAVPPSLNGELRKKKAVENLFSHAADEKEKEDEDLPNKLRDLLEKIFEDFESRNHVSSSVIYKVQSMYEEMRKKSIPPGDRVKEMIEQLRKTSLGLWKRILDEMREDDELPNKLRELLEKIIDENGVEGIPASVFHRVKSLYEEMRRKSIPTGDKVKEMIAELRATATGFWKRILDEMKEDEDLPDKLRKLLEKIFEDLENEKGVSTNEIVKVKSMYEEMRKKFIPPGDRVKEMIEQLREMSPVQWKRILDEMREDDDLPNKLRELLVKIFQDLETKGVSTSEIFKVRSMYEEMRKKSIPPGCRVKEMIEQLREKSPAQWKRIIDGMREDEDLPNKLRELLEKIFKDLETVGVSTSEIFKVQSMYEEMRKKSIPLGYRVEEMINQLRENSPDQWKRILDEMRGNNF